MHDRLSERETFAQALDRSQYRRPVVLAPHPDDEVYGCGGLLSLWSRDGVTARVILLTAGELQSARSGSDGGTRRVLESRTSAALLGYELQAWSMPDRELRCNETLIERLRDALVEFRPDVVLTPALTEPHPDHQATTLALLCALARLPSEVAKPDVMLYESGGALTQPNTVVDISSVRDLKGEAMSLFESQESVQPYRSRIGARDHFRALQLGPRASAAEVFTLLPTAQAGWPSSLPALEPIWLHARGQAAHPEEAPLVSVLVRTVGDSHLERTLASVAAQTYPRLEWVIVDADGRGARRESVCAPPGVTVRWMGDDRAMNRPRAANAALQAAKGEWLIFLDDDDLWTPDHVQRLVNAAQANGQVRAVHSDVQVVDQDGRELTRYDRPWLPQRMAFTNVLPIHSVLFDASLVRERGCSFDESMPVLEDWDFWLQVTRHTDVLHVPGVSAIYRYRDRSGLNSVDGTHQHRVWRDHVLGRWLQRFTERQTIDAIAWYTRCLDEEQQRARAAHLRAVALEERLQLFTAEAGAQSAGLQAALRDTQAELTAAGQALHSRAAQASQAEDRCAQLEAQLRDTQAELTAAGQALHSRAAQASQAEDHCAQLDAQLRDVKSELQAAGQRLEHAVLAATAAHEVKLVLENLNRTFQTELGAAQADWRHERKLLQAKVDQLDRQCRDLQDQCAEQAQTIAEIHRSSSWQVTRPWRWLGRILGRR